MTRRQPPLCSVAITLVPALTEPAYLALWQKQRGWRGTSYDEYLDSLDDVASAAQEKGEDVHVCFLSQDDLPEANTRPATLRAAAALVHKQGGSTRYDAPLGELAAREDLDDAIGVLTEEQASAAREHSDRLLQQLQQLANDLVQADGGVLMLAAKLCDHDDCAPYPYHLGLVHDAEGCVAFTSMTQQEITARMLGLAGLFGGDLVIRAFLPELHPITNLPMQKAYAWDVVDGEFRPVDHAELWNRACINTHTAEITPPELGVEYCDAPPAPFIADQSED